MVERGQHSIGAGVVVSLLLCICTLVASAEESALVTSQALSPELALKLARAAQQACRARDLQVSVAVVDRTGAPQVMLRDQLAGNFTYAIALRKARTAAGFRRATLDLAQTLAQRPAFGALQGVAGILLLAGGVPVEHDGTVIGAIGVSGAPAAEDDHACAIAGIAAIADDLAF